MRNEKPKGQHAALSEWEKTFLTSTAIWREQQWGEMRVGYETYLSDFDDAPFLKGLPEDRCQCPHWGYLLTGQMTVRYADHEEVIKAGEVYYMAPGHTLLVEAGTTLIEFSPKEEFQKLMEVAEQNLARMQQSQGNTP
ncbi:MAG: hypothetical protein LPK03_07265 [Pontibacter sp.]|nr:hypothetical protein [Pontibacter sp.]